MSQRGWQPGTEVIARYSFKGSSEEDLVFQKGDIMTIVTPTKDPNWYKARHGDCREGLIPANYIQKRSEVKLNAMPWFHGKITREEAEILLQPREDGLFLVRESTNFPGDYTLCVCYKSKVEHYRVIYKENKLTIDEEEYFENLSRLVEHYQNDADGLCTRLEQSVPKKGGPELSVDSQEFEKAGWTIKLEDLKLGEVIGKGEFGDVVLGCLRGQKVAVKVLKDNSKAAQSFLVEASVMTSLSHRNLVQLLGVVFDWPSIYIVTEFMSKGSLVDYLRSRGRQHVTKQDQIHFATCFLLEKDDDTDKEVSEWGKKHDDYSIFCQVCSSTVNISNKGFLTISQHVGTKMHQEQMDVKKNPLQFRLFNNISTNEEMRAASSRTNTLRTIYLHNEKESATVAEHIWYSTFLFIKSSSLAEVTDEMKLPLAKLLMLWSDCPSVNKKVNRLMNEEVCDFGLARERCFNLEGGKFPIKWTAPEALRHSNFSNKSDMWSFGILLWEIYSFGRVPYPRIPLADVVKHVEKGYRMEAPEGCPSDIYDIMKQAWDLEPENRPNFIDVLKRLEHLRALTD
ncbi:tyrosine-protein kinase CSK [Parasteatoda tepidariorum]|uniref:tyrosine-protein kinase CSK n=1 Tax=Parasteatoda tepidariorum TaxID=114398 RepID=UPI0039BC365D